MSEWQQLQVGDDFVGYVRVVGCDNFHIIGQFRAGPQYSKYSQLLEQSYHQADSTQCLNILEQIDNLGLRLVDPERERKTYIRDFPLGGLDQIHEEDGVPVEFKFCSGERGT